MKRQHQGKNRSKKSKGGRPQALARPMQGIDQKSFMLNDIVPLVLPNPENSTTYTVIIQADVNGWTYQILNSAGAPVTTQSAAYGQTTEQFETQAMFYTQYYTHSVDFDLSLSQGGSTYSMSPLVHLTNPNGQTPFVFGTGGFNALISSPQTTNVLQPYSRHRHSVTYSKWLMAMADRCWRKSIANPGVSSNREFYPSDGANLVEDFVVPAQVSAFQVTIPENRFETGAGNFVLGIFKTKAHFVFSQRRVDIGTLVQETVIREIEKKIERTKDKQSQPQSNAEKQP